MSWKVTTQAHLKFEDMERNHKAVSKKKKEHRHTPFELTPLLHCRNRVSHVKRATEQETVPQKAANKVRGTKTRQSALSKGICAALSLLWDRIFNSSLLDTDVIHQRWQMWHDSSAWEAAMTTDRKLLTAQCVTRGGLSDKTRYSNLLILCPVSPAKKVYRPKCTTASVVFVFVINFGKNPQIPVKVILIWEMRQSWNF